MSLTKAAEHTRWSRMRRKWLTITLFLLPALVLFCVMVLLPIAQAAYYSLFRWNGMQPLTDFVGLKNYQDAFGSELFTGAVEHNLFIVVLSLAIQIPCALGLALFLNRRFPGRTIFRIIFFFPYVISEVVTGIIFYLLLQPKGAVNSSLRAVGASGLTQDWWGNISTLVQIRVGPLTFEAAFVMLTLFVVISWKYFGFHMILLLAGLQGIPNEIREAAVIDGAGRWQLFRHITLPLLAPTLRVSIFLSVIGALQLFDMIYATTRGGPVHKSDTIAYYMYDFGYKRFEMGYGSAVAVLLFLMCFVFALFYQRFALRRDVEGALTFGG
jgi:raffinose/stachyose/melibiose transport system permease protein